MNRKLKIILLAAGVTITPVLLSPLPRFRSPLSTVIEARDGTLLGARIADDGQWRFPGRDEIPDKFEKAILTFEDRWFYYHPGINPVALVRAFIHNIKAHRIVSGGSTITMQVARISRGGKSRTYPEKIIEMLAALKLELFSSKNKILLMYTTNAPFGGNTVGLEAAAWRYTGKSASELTCAEASALAILPNSPALVFPGRNQEILRSKRNDLLRRLYEREYFDSLTLILSVDEPLPGEPKTLPSLAPHLTDYFFKKNKGARIKTTIDPILQQRVTEIINTHQKDLENNFIFNSACLIVEVETGNVLAYAGNSTLEDAINHGGNVDIIRSLRSTGSILKPILYAGMLQSGDILPNSLVADIPTRFPGFSPKNFDQSFSGAVPAGSALSQSLNVPAVKMLQKYNPEKFLDLLKKTGFTSFRNPADYYGLSMILGGGEISLWELTGTYASLSRVLKRYNHEKKYFKNDYHPPVIIEPSDTVIKKVEEPVPPLSASAIWLTYEALQKVNRPESEAGWQYFASSPNLAWKTGTSFGFRDGWAVGTTPDYVAGVWTGNADGEGRPGLTGTSAAAPILFDIVSLMGSQTWFSSPDEDLTMIRVCSKSGFRAGADCPETVEIPASINGLRSEVCPYHKLIHLNLSKTLQVTSECASANDIINIPWFILPPAMEYFYRQKHPEYKVLPPVSPGCSAGRNIQVMEFIYPTQGIKIFIPRDQEGKRTRIIPEVAHRNPSKKIFWHLDDSYVATTRSIHQINIQAEPGNHILTVVDEDGNSLRCSFTITGTN
ncbi:MAG: penicillin-binding protein 1C [Bacteroidales bacterium]|nr:penicillin-binding protein 1C [Bacteroidales bacterium]